MVVVECLFSHPVPITYWTRLNVYENKLQNPVGNKTTSINQRRHWENPR